MIPAALKKLGMDIPDDVLASVILDCLPSEYDPIKKNCRAAHKKWSTHELISQCVNYEECLKLKKKNQALAASKVMSGTKRKSSED
ncbi:unnamed protein product [Thlaspi arvense]|uniref:F-box domain-containing protein n=1 Tax=Thlaspi arvense TaxID=13288 RepID=A0AAU9SNM6_THLAR|nr:unnamed protein product [Thlaspi arvense]